MASTTAAVRHHTNLDGPRKLRGASGVIGGLLLTAVMVMAVAIEPGAAITGKQLLQHYADDGRVIFASWATMQWAGIALLWFLGSLRSRLIDAGAERHAATAVIGGTALVALAYVSRAIAVAMPAFATFGLEDGVLDPNTAKLLGIASYEILAGAGVAASVLVGAVAIAGRRTGLLGAGMTRAGYVIAAVAVFSSAFAYLPVAAVGLWIAAVSLKLREVGRSQ